MTFRALFENKLLGKLKPHEKLLFNAYIDFLQEYYKTNINLEISFRKPNTRKLFGWIDLIGLQNKKYKIIVEYKPYGMLGTVGHEFTHIHQFLRGDLGYSKDEKYILWNKKEFITVKEYSKINDFATYKKIPWEAEAYKMQDKLPGLFLKSKQFKNLKGKNETLDFLIDNDSIS
jgi:hypothetical protein